jgi:(2R)-sulfolactate sulfo-lyase subunit beta
MTELLGFRRPNGRVGVRNHVIILPVDDISNTAAEVTSRVIQGTLSLPHSYGRLQFGEDLELTFKTLIGTASNPNVAAAVIIGIEPNWTNKIVDAVSKAAKKPVEGLSIEHNGDLKTIEKASRIAKMLLQDASEIKREPISLGELTIGIKCGESDTTSGLAANPALGRLIDRLVNAGCTVIFGETSELTGAEDFIAERMATPELKEKFMKVYGDYMAFIESQGVDLLGSQPTQGNIAGGLSTIEEKGLGNVQKTGTCPIVGVLGPAETPTDKGLFFMDSSSAAAEMVTLAAAAGSVLHFFTTGQGNVVGNPIVPVVKISAHPRTVVEMAEHIDVDLSGIIRRELSLDRAADAISDVMNRTINGRLTAAEALGHREFVLTKLYRSA